MFSSSNYIFIFKKALYFVPIPIKHQRMIRFIVLYFFLFSYISLHAAEDFGWWTAIHNWDGHTPWNQYLTISPAFMGPNALPVPEVTKGAIDSSAELEVAGDYHYCCGDKTIDFYTKGYLPLFNNKMSVSVDVIPYEWFKTDTATRDRRAARTRSGKGGAGGDIYFYTNFQLLKNHPHLPDLLFEAAFRTASGTNLRNARYTDGAGYFFDVSAGKNYSIKKNILRLYLMTGFYDYQTFDLQHLQNDCFLYGVGTDFTFNRFQISQSLAGYSGYLDIGDKPLVYRASVRLKNPRFDWKLSYQTGLNDYPFQRFRLSLIWHIPPPFKHVPMV